MKLENVASVSFGLLNGVGYQIFVGDTLVAIALTIVMAVFVKVDLTVEPLY